MAPSTFHLGVTLALAGAGSFSSMALPASAATTVMFPPRTFSFEFDGRERHFVLKLPAGYRPGSPHPLVINLHGAGGTGEQQRLTSGFDQVADEQNLIVAYPDGVNRTWEAGGPGPEQVDDVGFIAALIDGLAANLSIDLSRVYATGFSNGGFMSYRLACELEDRIAAVGSVAGLMNQDIFDGCAPARPVPVMHIHGTRDRIVPYNGQANFFPGVDAVLAFWGEQNGCSPPIEQVEIPNRVLRDQSTVTRFSVSQCTAGTEVELWRVNQGGHTWPGSAPVPIIGPTNQDIDASVELANFFSRHQLPAEFLTAAPAQPDAPPFKLQVIPEGDVIDQ